jgi:electron transfer flavoprotein alpha subunit
VGATRAAVSCGWTDPRNLITSGKHRLSPRLYVACGVIGEYDHLRAIEESNQIIAITADPTVPITEMADLVGVGEPTTVLREMVETLRKARQERFLINP